MTDERIEPLSIERVYDGRLLKVDREELVLPNGNRASLETIKHPGAAAIVPFVDAETIVLLRQYRHAAGGMIYEIPAGKLDVPGEPPRECAARELEEEAGFRAGRIEPLGSILTTPGFTDEVIWLFAGYELVKTAQALEQDECIDVLEVPFRRAVEMVQRDEIRDAKTVAALLRAAVASQSS